MLRRCEVTDPAPFVKWAGGKRALLPELLKRVPKNLGRFGRYFEPFVGGGALFFALQVKAAMLADLNEDLVTTYMAVRDDVEGVIVSLQRHALDHSEDHYYDVRASIQDLDAVGTAARFIYLNKTCFNGLYRVNKANRFNVPFGRYDNPKICDADRLRVCSAALQGVPVYTADFRSVAAVARVGDFCYFDPPYVPLSASSNFTSYTRDKFTSADQVSLCELARSLKRRGVHVLLSNSSAARDLYSGGDFVIEEVQCRRSVNSKAGGRGAITELLIS
jgi:DNA adenine methylase